ncbi:hypothetical protein ES703_98958 [subsurface metagenome]
MNVPMSDTSLMAAATLAMAIATFVMAQKVKKASKEDTKAHHEDREKDEAMHTREHIIALAHLEAEQLPGGLRANTNKALGIVKKKVFETLNKQK